MGFRFRNMKPICKSLSRLSSTRDIRATSAITNSLSTQFRCFPPYLLSENPSYNIPKRWHLGHAHEHHERQQLQTKEGEKIFLLGLSADVGLAGAKALTGYLSGSTAIIADAAHSVSDVVLSGVALLSFKAGNVPKDEDHPYGHGKFETLGALGISCMLLATAGGIAWHAVDLLLVLSLPFSLWC